MGLLINMFAGFPPFFCAKVIKMKENDEHFTKFHSLCHEIKNKRW